MVSKWEHEMGCVCGMREAEEKCLQLFGWKESLLKEITWKTMCRRNDVKGKRNPITGLGRS